MKLVRGMGGNRVLSPTFPGSHSFSFSLFSFFPSLVSPPPPSSLSWLPFFCFPQYDSPQTGLDYPCPSTVHLRHGALGRGGRSGAEAGAACLVTPANCLGGRRPGLCKPQARRAAPCFVLTQSLLSVRGPSLPSALRNPLHLLVSSWVSHGADGDGARVRDGELGPGRAVGTRVARANLSLPQTDTAPLFQAWSVTVLRVPFGVFSLQSAI